MEITEKVAYIKGLMEGMEFDATTKEGKVIAAIVDVLTDITEKVTVMDDEVGDLFDEVDAVSEDLSDVEEYLWEDDDDDDYDEEDDEEYDDSGLYEITCPNCGEVVCVDEDMLDDENLSCPNCGTKFEVDFSDDCDCEGCKGCGDK
ncbi:MAG: hypothetical protein EOM30_00255 [Clostridia bacterium]|nr:hypothetical protein [Clostridia bacterium]NLS84380.1 hypothetical protein [Oscillospiraceae bacterium]